jgi:hypothetical protein
MSTLAQTTLVDWDQSWNYMHPTAGALPAGSGTTIPHPDGTTPWYATASQFNASYSGPSFTTGGGDFEAGSGTGPLGYGTITYTTDPGAEFLALGTTLTPPDSGGRYTAYFRTTFTAPDDGNFYVNPVLRYLTDDGAFVYLDGELVLEMNTGGGADDYLALAAGVANTETELRSASLGLPAGSSTGGNTDVEPPIVGNATVVKSLPRLTPGTHTLAVSLHNAGNDSSDLALAVQITADVTDCFITGSTSAPTRNFNGTPANDADDTISTELTVASEGTVSASWQITGPVGSSLIGRTGAYNTPVTLSGIPIAGFSGGNLTIAIADSANASCTTRATVFPPRIIGSNTLAAAAVPITSQGSFDIPGWAFNEATPSLTMNSPGGTGPFTITSAEINLTGRPDVQFTGTLTINDTSSGNEENDTFVAFLIYDNDTANPINLITRHDLMIEDGVLSDDELAPAAGTFVKTLNHVVPASVNSVRFVVEAVNNSASETFIVSNVGVATAPPELQAYAGPSSFDNMGTPDPGDDIFTTDVIITPVNLGVSTGWSSDATPAGGLYATGNPVKFGPLRPFQSPLTVTLRDVVDTTKTAAVPLILPTQELTVSAPANVVRVENGPGLEDDTLTFDLTITGTNGGPGWKTNSAAISPTSGSYGVTSFTVPAPLVQETLFFDLVDASYPLLTATASVPVTGRYFVGQSDLSGSLESVETDLIIAPSPLWTNDATARTLTLSANSATLAVVQTEVIDLTAQDEIFFSGTLRALDTSGGSNFESGDRFKAELIYNVGGVPNVINLVDPYDVGDGSPSTTGTLMGANGPVNGFINGYGGGAGTDLVDGVTVYATNAEDYNAHVGRDEFNRAGELASANLNNLFILTAAIPAEADDVTLVITGQGVGGSETLVVSDVLFSTSNNTGDTDGDDLPNDYEVANGLNPSDPSDRDTDLDGDGQSNYSEFLASTAPNDATSLLRFTNALITNATVSATWSSVPGKTYRVDFSTDLVNWTDLGLDFAAAAAPAAVTSSGELNLATIGSPEKAFFRVRVAE